MLDEKEVVIDGRRYFVGQLNAWDSWLLQKYVTAATKVIGKLLSGGVKDTSDIEEILPAIAGFFDSLSESEMRRITRGLLSKTSVVVGTGSNAQAFPLFSQEEGGADQFDLQMRGRMLHVWRLCWESVQLSYNDFFTALAARKESQKTVPQAQASESNSSASTV